MIVDDHKMVREGLTKLIELDGEIKVVEEATDGLDCIHKLRKAKPDVILLDLNMPDMDGIETLKTLNRKKSRPKVLVLTVHNEIEYLMKMLDMGVDGYILKDSSSRELIRAIRFVYEGDRFIQPGLIPLLNSKLIAKDIDREKLDTLTNRELEILKLVALGHFNKDIASILSITERTVKNHLTSVFQKRDICTEFSQHSPLCLLHSAQISHKL